jgi:Protein of unknown function (DUF1592)/Protein of unknown function (DUF1588)/Protein of unknown function (DUF1595)/Protein of unknown function (DUF1585)/Protein of unknown function (DUF1587)
MTNVRASSIAFALVLPACYHGSGGGDGGADGTGGSASAESGGGTADSTGDVPDAPELGGVGIMGLRRLSSNEYDNTIRDLIGDDSAAGAALLPEDVVDPFDNQFSNQIASRTLIEGLEQLAGEQTASLLADAPRRDMVVGCSPSGPADAECLGDFTSRFGRRALRRPLDADEVQNFVDLGLAQAAEEDDFYAGVGVILRAFLQDPEFVYRVEIGTPTDEAGVYRLSDFEVATRLSYFLWGTTPDDALLDRAEAGELVTPDDVRAAALEMLADERALPRIDRFHSMWLGYYRLPHDPALTAAMRTETRMLLDKTIVQDKADWRSLFAATGTFLNDELATHYGLPTPGSTEFTWVDYGDSGRKGLLSQGSFLSVAGKFGDTSPTQRGKLIRKRLFCQVIPPPPPEVNVDEPPPEVQSPCKIDRYNMSQIDGCAACHELMDPVGFGLENYDQAGRFRTTDNGLPQCEITGEGTIDGMSFQGPDGLSDLLLEQGLLDTCIVSQVYQFAMGHPPAVEDDRYVEDLSAAFSDGGFLFDELMLDLVADEAFLYRREEG